METDQVGEISVTDAQRYYDENRELWAVVLMPWVLVQDKPWKHGPLTPNPTPD